MVRNSNVTEKIKCQKIDKYFFKTPKGRIQKYLKYCRRKNCKTESSYNYENLKPKYCFKHKKENMLNVKLKHTLCQNCKSSYNSKCTSPQCKYTIENYKTQSKYMKLKTIDYLKENNIEFYLCKICGEIVDKNHFYTQEHIDKFNDVCIIDIKKYFENVFLTVNCKFLDMRYNYIYSDLYFKKHIKELILKNINVDKYYKPYIIKKLILDFNDKENKYYSEKFNSNNILKDIQNIEKIEKNDDIIQPYLIKNLSKDYNFDLERMYFDLGEIQMIESGLTITVINNTGCQIKISECELIRGSSFENIPKIFYNSKIINIMQNKDKNVSCIATSKNI